MSNQELTQDEINFFVLFFQINLTKILDMRFRVNRNFSSIVVERKEDDVINIIVNNPIYKISAIYDKTEDQLLDEVINNVYQDFSYLMINKFPNISKQDDSLNSEESDVGVE